MSSAGAIRRRLELSGRRARTWRPTGRRGWALLRSLMTSYIALGVTLYILPGRQSSGPWSVLLLTITVALVGLLVRPVLAALAVLLGPFALLLLGFIGQAIILDIAISLAPDVHIRGDSEVLLVSWAAAAVAAAVDWLFDAGSEDVFLAQLLGRAVRVADRVAEPAGSPGLLVIQLDGVGEGLLREAITAGAVPTLSSWLRSGSHTLRPWSTGLPATTPAGQAVLLYGNVSEVPSFRWYEKETGHLLVASHPADAAELERRMSDGKGLLAGGGVSVSNLFSGDAALTLLTLSDARLPSRHTHGIGSYVTNGGGLVRSLVVSIGLVVTELYQGRRQRRRDVLPRVHRGLTFAIQRSATTAFLRDISVAIVAEQVARAAPVIYVDLTEYDEVAHHAGPSRPESLRSLDALDRLVGFFADVVLHTHRAYEIVVVSDHGQAQGATFSQLAGMTLHELVSELSSDEHGRPAVAAHDEVPAERWSSTNMLLTSAARSHGLIARALRRARTATPAHAGTEITMGQADASAMADARLVVAAGGSLAHVYLPDVPGRVSREEIDLRYPRLVDGLARHPQVGAVMVRSADGDPVVLGGTGWRLLTEQGAVGGEGDDPVAVFGASAATDLYGLDGRNHVGDLVLLGRYDPATEEVAAFEELVGSHGGLGGGQTGAALLHPSTWSLPGGELHGVDIHEILRGRVPVRERDAT